jgi:hypothetical protein
VLVFDQFEELFSRTGGNVRLIAEVFDALADLAENRVEASVAESRSGRDALDLISQRYRMLLSFREDFLPDVRAWERQVPSLLRNDLRLVAMSREQAVAAVRQSGAELLAPGAAEQLVDFVGALAASTRSPESGNTTLSGRRAQLTIEPALLSLCGAQLAQRVAPGRKIDGTLLSQVGFDILEGFYRDALADMPDHVQCFIEDHLLQGDRTRGSYARDEAIDQRFIDAHQLAVLTEQRRLLRVSQEGGVPRIELIHDRLVDVVKKARDRRQAVRHTEAARAQERREAADRLAAEQAARLEVETAARAKAERDASHIARKNRWLGGVAAVMLVAMSTAIWQYSVAEQESARYQGVLNGFLQLAPKANEAEGIANGYAIMQQQFAHLNDGLTAVGIWRRQAGDAAAGLGQVLQAQAELVERTAAFADAGPAREVRPTEVALLLGFDDGSPQQDLLQRTLTRWKFTLRHPPDARPGGSASVLVGEGVPAEDVRVVALSLVRAGVPVRSVQRLRAAAGVVVVRPEAALAASDPPALTVAQIVEPGAIP